MPIKFPDSFLSSLSFDPLSSTSSDSESEHDEVARATKRRRIERVAQDYLHGHPPFILTATLNGPFDDGWVNPWRKARSPRSVSLPHSTKQHNSRPGVIQAENPLSPAPATVQGTPSLVPGSDSHQRNHSAGDSQRRRIRTNLGSRASSRHSSKSRSATASDAWLKRDNTQLHQGLHETPKSPSPSPAVRLNSCRVSKRPSERSQRSLPSPCRSGTPVSQNINLRTINFTAINAPVPAARLSTPTAHQASSHNKQAAFIEQNHCGESSVGADKLRMLHKSSLEESIRLPMGPSTGSGPSRVIPRFEPVLCKKNQHEADIPAPAASSTLNATNNSSLGNAATSGSKFEPLQESETIAKERQKASITCNTSLPPLSLRESEMWKTGSTLPEQDTETMPAAQVVPPIFTPPQLTPFTSADLLQLPFHQSNHSATDGGGPPNSKRNKHSDSQASAPTTQKSGTNKNASPPTLKGAQQRPTNLLRRAASSSSLQKGIKPFHSFTGSPRAQGSKSKPSVVSKNARFHDANTDISNQANEYRATTPKQLQTSSGPNKIALSASCPPGLRAQKITDPSQPPTRAPPGSLLVREQPSTACSSGAPLSLAMAMSGFTDLSTQPDGQGLLVLQENFDLTGAIEDAESFLQSWDIERDRQLLRDNTTTTTNGLKPPAPKV
ncbi:hypothetical protein MGYG_00079 [Nannizzia gypsea CBS 118893]|uniref:Uncharacterized protein n=1 Tax=Arthroderma gypseum (strain ATCC MYA-4604 / CBS 118893) TaxID=535722 RepID=E5R2Q1_ARTGP|nr:hypothetical protein MGYG_00079 [Nannizzia gypsea CBS 118893]EFQ97035.1 hypothetical protein MGYG_00079 [Nannizzia gypsea CBS 118893]